MARLPVSTDRGQVLGELLRRSQNAGRASRQLWGASRLLHWGALTFQFIVAVAISFLGGPHGAWLAGLSVVPTTLLTAARAFGLLPMSGWHFELKNGVDDLVADLESGDAPDVVWRRFLALEAAKGRDFPQGGSPI